MTRVSFHRLAANELTLAFDWYAQRNRSVAERFQLAIDATVERIHCDPVSHPVEAGRFHWARVRRFPYRLIFEIDDPESITVLAVAHTSRRPRYWRRRTT